MSKWKEFFQKKKKAYSGNVKILKHNKADRIVFFYPGEEGTYVDNVTVTIFENGVVHLKNEDEETTTHIQYCEVLWKYKKQEDKPKRLSIVDFKKE